MSHGVILFAFDDIERRTSIRLFTLNIYLWYPDTRQTTRLSTRVTTYRGMAALNGTVVTVWLWFLCVWDVLYDVDALQLNA